MFTYKFTNCDEFVNSRPILLPISKAMALSAKVPSYQLASSTQLLADSLPKRESLSPNFILYGFLVALTVEFPRYLKESLFPLLLLMLFAGFF
ncbi:hypothetical protein R80B4_01659 [Fibrobacteres bacterium R8-0-B4]